MGRAMKEGRCRCHSYLLTLIMKVCVLAVWVLSFSLQAEGWSLGPCLCRTQLDLLTTQGSARPQAIQHFCFNSSQPGHIISMLTDSRYRSIKPVQGDCPILLWPSSVFLCWTFLSPGRWFDCANWLRTPSVQSHCLATFNPFMLIGVCVTNSCPDTASGCPVWNCSHTPIFYCVLSFWSLLWVRNWARPISLLGMLSTQGDLMVLDHQQPMTQPHWELSLANQLVRYAVHLRGPHGTWTPTAHDTTPFGLPGAHRVFNAPDPWAVFFWTSHPNWGAQWFSHGKAMGAAFW